MKEGPRRWVLLCLWAACAVYVFRGLLEGWIPHDEGTLAHSAERVLRGELPHRDFDATYTGGLALFHAGVFELFGLRLAWLRYAVFGAFVAAVPAVLYLATRFLPLVGAALASLVAVAWSLPVYEAAMPSWYNLFLALGAAACAYRRLEAGGRRWLLAAGGLAGLSTLIKVSGLYLLAALLLFCVFVEQEEGLAVGGDPPGGGDPGRASRGHSLFVTLSLVLFVGAVAWAISGFLVPETLFHFVLPAGALAGWLIEREWRSEARRAGADRFRDLAGLLAPLLSGFALPVVVFLVPYAASGSLDALLHGVFVLPLRRLEFALQRPPSPLQALALVPALVVVARARRWRRALRWTAVGALVLLLGAILLFAGDRPLAYRAGFVLLRPLVPVGVVAGVLLLARRGERGSEALPRAERAGIFLLLAVAGLCSLIQYPTAHPVYFFYAAPLAVLAVAGLLRALPEPSWTAAGALGGFALLFAVLWIHPGFVYQMGRGYAPLPPTVPLELERAGIRVVAGEAEEYEKVVAAVEDVTPGAYLYVTPDAPELYFLTGKRNPTRTLFDFFEAGEGRAERILRTLERHGVGTVVFNRRAIYYDRPASVALRERLAPRFPNRREVGRFVVRWREADPGR